MAKMNYSFWKLIDVYEIDTPIFQEISGLRIELYCLTTDECQYKYKIMKYELFRIQSTVPSDKDGNPVDCPSDEVIMSAFNARHLFPDQAFEAKNSKEAFLKMQNDLFSCFEHIVG